MRKYVWLFAVLILLIFCLPALIILLAFDELRGICETAIGCFAVAGIMLAEAKFALRPNKKWGRANGVKGMFHLMKKPKIYRNICLSFYLIFLLVGISKFTQCLMLLST